MRNAIGALCVALAAAGLPAGAAPAERVAPGRMVDLIADPNPSSFRIPRQVPLQKDFPAPDATAATFAVNFLPAGSTSGTATCIAWPTDAQAAFAYAAGIWARQIESSVTITVDACWASNLAPGVLGSAGANTYHRDFAGADTAGTWYPASLAAAQSGADQNGTTAEIRARFSSTFDWYLGTDGNPGTKFDFVTVVLHEIGHGLGFVGFMDYSAGTGSWGLGSGYPSAYDRYTENGAGQALLNTALFPNPSTALGAQLTGNNLFFDGPHTNAGNGGVRAPLYAPATFDAGSSYSHLGEAFNGTSSALMTYSLAAGEVLHDPGPVARGVLQDLGWKLGPDGVVVLTVTKPGAGSGVVASSPAVIACGATCAGELNRGSVVTLTATPATGSTFAGWSGDCSGPGSCIVTMNAAKSVAATFTLNTYAITTTASPVAGGTVTCTPNPVSHGSTASCTATANQDYAFTGWSGACSGSTSPCTTTVAAGALTVTGLFRETVPPETTITSSPASVTNSTSASFGFTSSEANSTFECSLDSGAFAACTSPKGYTGLAGGAHTFRVRAIDAAGNVDASPASYTWTVDTTAPSVTITSPAVINETNQGAYGVSGTCSENGRGVNVTVGSVPGNTTCASGAYSVTGLNVSAVPDGTVLISASQTDAAGNTGSATANVVKDGSIPANLVLTNRSLTGTQVFVTRGILTLGPGVTLESGAVITLTAGQRVVFVPPVEIAPGATFEIVIDPSLKP